MVLTHGLASNTSLVTCVYLYPILIKWEKYFVSNETVQRYVKTSKMQMLASYLHTKRARIGVLVLKGGEIEINSCLNSWGVENFCWALWESWQLGSHFQMLGRAQIGLAAEYKEQVDLCCKEMIHSPAVCVEWSFIVDLLHGEGRRVDGDVG